MAVQERLGRLNDFPGGLRLEPDFADTLAKTIERFNGFTASGVDEDFGSGKLPVERDWAGPARPDNELNPMMHPFSDSGPYYAVLQCGHILDTKGGPRRDPDA